MKRQQRQRRSTRFSDNGLTVFVRLRVDRRDYEFARHWAFEHADNLPSGAAEDQLEGSLNMAMLSAMQDSDWQAPLEIEALYAPYPKAGPMAVPAGAASPSRIPLPTASLSRMGSLPRLSAERSPERQQPPAPRRGISHEVGGADAARERVYDESRR